MSDRTPPQNYEAEQAVLGALLMAPDALTDVVPLLFSEDFYRPAHETIYNVILDLFSQGKPVDAITVSQALTEAGEIARIGGAPYLHTLLESTPIAASATHYADIVHGLAVKRRVVDAGTRIVQHGYSEADADSTLDAAQQALNEIEQMQTRGEDYVPMSEVLVPTLDEVQQIEQGGGPARGVPTGFYDLDDLTNGLHPGQMIVVAGRPGSGKSTLALDIARSASVTQGMCTGFFSLEMNRSEITMRLLSAEARVALAKIRGGHLGEDDWEKIARHLDTIGGAPLFLDDSPNLTMTEIRAKARRLKRTQGLRLVVIDYMQLMSSGRKVESRQLEVSEFSRQMKLMAKELDVPVVALSQLNRGPEHRSSRRPLLSDLRESGSIEQDADVVILVHREDMYEAESTRPGEADLIVAKHRNGPTRDIVVAAQLHYSRFTDLAR